MWIFLEKTQGPKYPTANCTRYIQASSFQWSDEIQRHISNRRSWFQWSDEMQKCFSRRPPWFILLGTCRELWEWQQWAMNTAFNVEFAKQWLMRSFTANRCCGFVSSAFEHQQFLLAKHFLGSWQHSTEMMSSNPLFGCRVLEFGFCLSGTSWSCIVAMPVDF